MFVVSLQCFVSQPLSLPLELLDSPGNHKLFVGLTQIFDVQRSRNMFYFFVRILDKSRFWRFQRTEFQARLSGTFGSERRLFCCIIFLQIIQAGNICEHRKKRGLVPVLMRRHIWKGLVRESRRYGSIFRQPHLGLKRKRALSRRPRHFRVHLYCEQQLIIVLWVNINFWVLLGLLHSEKAWLNGIFLSLSFNLGSSENKILCFFQNFPEKVLSDLEWRGGACAKAFSHLLGTVKRWPIRVCRVVAKTRLGVSDC